MSIGVVVGRFQTPILHKGHRALLDYASEHNDSLVIVVGVSPLPSTRKDPLDFSSRVAMLRSAYHTAFIVPLMDHPNDAIWSKNLDKLIQSIHTFADVTLYGGRDSFIKSYSGAFATEEVAELSNLSATELRKEAASTHMSSTDFRNGVIYSVYNSFPRVNPTVDIAVVKQVNGKDNYTHEVLMGKKPTDSLWRFPGGFVDAADETLEAAAIRECHEETGLLVEFPKYIGSFRVDDWRCTEGYSIMTSFFEGSYSHGNAVAGDDLAIVNWIPINRAAIPFVGKGHRILMETLIDKYRKY